MVKKLAVGVILEKVNDVQESLEFSRSVGLVKFGVDRHDMTHNSIILQYYKL